MLLTSHAERAVDLVHVDLGALRSVQGELAALVDAPAVGQGAVVVEVLHRTLARNPLRPSVSGHDESRWPLHVNDEGATVAETLTSEAMTLLVTEVGATRLGRCASRTCTRACVDTSANSSRGFCRSRCSTRENMAALRRRRATGVHR